MKTLFHNGRLLTQDPSMPEAEAFLVEDGTITAVGKDEDFNIPGVQKKDLGERWVIPGFNDAHIHVWKVGQLTTHILDLRGTESISKLQDRIRKAAEAVPAGTWIIGRGFNEAVLAERRLPVKEDLDYACPDHPVYLVRTCAHIAVLNSVALKKCSITRDTTDPAGGAIGQTEGAPNGLLYETALGLATPFLPPLSQDDYRTMILEGARQLLQAGITSATDPAVHPELLNAYLNLGSEDTALRLNLFPILLPDGGEKPYPIPDVMRTPRKRITAVKFFSDGGLSGKTAALYRCYKNSDDRGILRLDREYFHKLAGKAMDKGLNIATHAIGDRAIDLVLDVYEGLVSKPNGSLNRIEHFGLPSDEALTRMAKNKFIAVPQPVFLDELGENFISAIDDDYLSRCYPMRSLIRLGIPFALSTDAPVVRNFNPWSNIRTAVNRRTAGGHTIAAHESLTVAEAIRAYTAGSAYAEGTSTFKGTLTAGKVADFLVLDRDPLNTAVDELEQIRIEEVYSDGIPVRL